MVLLFDVLVSNQLPSLAKWALMLHITQQATIWHNCEEGSGELRRLKWVFIFGSAFKTTHSWCCWRCEHRGKDHRYAIAPFTNAHRVCVWLCLFLCVCVCLPSINADNLNCLEQLQITFDLSILSLLPSLSLSHSHFQWSNSDQL